MSKHLGKCPKCLEVKCLTRHHIHPKRFFYDSPIFWLCRECHDALELNIPVKPKLKESEYELILKKFMEGGYDEKER